MAEQKPSVLEKAFYIFLLGASTYAWWLLTSKLRQKIIEG